MDDFPSIIAAWPSLKEFGDDLGVPKGNVKQWRRRRSIPAPYWQRLVDAAQARRIAGITLEKLAALAAAEQRQAA